MIEKMISSFDGTQLYMNSETAADNKAIVVIVHGLCEHQGRYDYFVEKLHAAGYGTYRFDHRGHGRSQGDRPNYGTYHEILDDTNVIVDMAIAENPDIPVYLLGHSMGGFTALNAIAQGLPVRGGIIMAPCDMGMRYEDEPEKFAAMMETATKGYFRLSHETALQEDLQNNYKTWRFDALADKIPQTMPLHFIGATRDSIVPPSTHILPLYRLLQERNMDVSYQELATGHIFANCRIALTDMIFDLVAQMDH